MALKFCKPYALIACIGLSLTYFSNASAATCSKFTMTADAGSTGLVTCIAGQKNITLENGKVTQINGSVKTTLFTDVVDLTSQISGIANNAPKNSSGFGAFSVNASVWNTWDSIYIALKQKDEFGLFELTSLINSGLWQTPSGNSGKVGTGLSHYLAFGGTLKPPSEVPVPAAVWLFGSALAGLMGFSRQKRASVA